MRRELGEHETLLAIDKARTGAGLRARSTPGATTPVRPADRHRSSRSRPPAGRSPARCGPHTNRLSVCRPPRLATPPLTLQRVERQRGRPVQCGDPPHGGRPRLVPRRCRPRTGRGWGWSPRPASRRSSRGCATAASSTPVTADVFGTAPRELTRSITPAGRPSTWCGRSSTSSSRTLPALAEPGEEQALRESVLRYSPRDRLRRRRGLRARRRGPRRLGRAARGARRRRGAARRGRRLDAVAGRRPRLGLHHPGRRGRRQHASRRLGRRGGRAAPRGRTRLDVDTLAAVQGRRLVCILGNVDDPLAAARELGDHFGDGARRRRPDRPPPVRRRALGPGSPGRAVLRARLARGAPPGRRRRPARRAGARGRRACAGAAARPHLAPALGEQRRRLLETAAAYLETGGGLEGTARMLFVHPNTVRYRLGKIADLTGYQLDRPARRPHRADRPRPGPAQPRRAHRVRYARQAATARPVCRNPPTRRAGCSCRTVTLGSRAERKAGNVLAIVCPGQGSQTPGFLAPWLELPAFRERLESLSDVAGLDLVAHGTTSDAETIKDTAVAQPLIVAAGLAAAARAAPEAAPAGRVGVDRRALGRRDHRRRLRRGAVRPRRDGLRPRARRAGWPPRAPWPPPA